MLTNNLYYTAIALFGALAIAILIETIVPLQRISWNSRALGGLLVTIISSTIALVAYFLGQVWRALGIEAVLPPVEQWAGWAAIPVTIVFGDFLRYWEHRFEHRFFWSVHVVHHSPTNLHALVNYGHPLHAIPLFFLVLLPLSILNFNSLYVPLAVTLALGVLNAVSHSSSDFHFGPFRHILIDNRFHRIHHSLEPRHFDRNFGVIFSIWDRLFGTAYFPEKDEWPSVGVAGKAQPRSLAEYLWMPFRSSRGRQRV